MQKPAELRILFPTSFSDSCFRTARAIAQLADGCRICLTIVHVVPPGEATGARRRELDSFLAEADDYDGCQRLLLESEDAVSGIADLCARECFDLVMAPSSDRVGLQRLFTSSFRARLLEECCTPVWTVGSCLDQADFRHAIRTVACLVDFDRQSESYLRLAVEFAAQMGARMRLLHVIPAMHEGLLARAIDSNAPLMPEVAIARLRAAFAGRNCPEIDVAVGEVSRELPGMLSRCEADLTFVGPGQGLNGGWRTALAPALDRLPCPAICVDGGSADFQDWTFSRAQRNPGSMALELPGDYAIAS